MTVDSAQLYLSEYRDLENDIWYSVYNKLDNNQAKLLGHINLSKRYFLKSEHIIRNIKCYNDTFTFTSDNYSCKPANSILNEDEMVDILRTINRVANNKNIKNYGVYHEEAHHF
jgi:hypothetical protein